jgi:hypothetical protein
VHSTLDRPNQQHDRKRQEEVGLEDAQRESGPGGKRPSLMEAQKESASQKRKAA